MGDCLAVKTVILSFWSSEVFFEKFSNTSEENTAVPYNMIFFP